jgi:hypothetical protein
LLIKGLIDWFKEVALGEFEPGLLKELFQNDRLKRGIMILLEPLTEKDKNLTRNKEMFFTPGNSDQAKHHHLVYGLNCD